MACNFRPVCASVTWVWLSLCCAGFSPWCGWRPPAPASCGCSWTVSYLTAAGWSPGSWLQRWSHQSGLQGHTGLGLEGGENFSVTVEITFLSHCGYMLCYNPFPFYISGSRKCNSVKITFFTKMYLWLQWFVWNMTQDENHTISEDTHNSQ